jgi:CRP-like cAMP-binding protein
MAPWGRDRKVELLARLPMFGALSRRELGQLAAVSVPDQLAPGAVLTRQGQKGGLAYVIAEGSAEVVRGSRRLAVLGPGDVVGELSLIDGAPRSATVRALTPLEVLEISASDLNRLVRKSPGVRRRLLEALAGRLRQADRLSAAGL